MQIDGNLPSIFGKSDGLREARARVCLRVSFHLQMLRLAGGLTTTSTGTQRAEVASEEGAVAAGEQTVARPSPSALSQESTADNDDADEQFKRFFEVFRFLCILSALALDCIKSTWESCLWLRRTSPQTAPPIRSPTTKIPSGLPNMCACTSHSANSCTQS